MTPTPLDVRAFAAHVADHHPVRCVLCRHADTLRLNRIAMLPDAGPGAHLGETDAPLEEQATPVAVVMCVACYTLQFYAWLPIVEAFNRAVEESLAALNAIASTADQS